MTPSSASGLPTTAIQPFACGLYYVANIDGLEPREEELIREFLQESGSDLAFEDLASLPFEVDDLAIALETTYLRRLFLRAAIALVKLDGVFSDGERHAIGNIADAFRMTNAEFGDLEQEASRVRL